MNNLCIIPARGGSKRIPKKNIKSFLGKPIMGYSIKAAISSKLFDEIMVSTDDQEIAMVAEKVGAKIPFLRSSKNADDYAVLADVILEVIEQYRNKGRTFDYVCCILPTAPFVNSQKLQEGFKKIKEKDFDSVFPVLKYSFPIQRSLQLKKDKIEMVWEKYLNSRSQDLDPRYYDSGQFYWIKIASFLKEKKLYTSNSGAIIVSELEAQDIDTIEDWKLAELKYTLLKSDQ